MGESIQTAGKQVRLTMMIDTIQAKFESIQNIQDED